MVNELIESSWLPSVAVVRFVNRGLAWGYGSGIPDFWLMPYVCYWPLVCLVALTAWALWQAWRGRLSPLESLGLAAMVGGGSSNVLDSWRLAYVVDTVAIKTAQWAVATRQWSRWALDLGRPGAAGNSLQAAREHVL